MTFEWLPHRDNADSSSNATGNWQTLVFCGASSAQRHLRHFIPPRTQSIAPRSQHAR